MGGKYVVKIADATYYPFIQLKKDVFQPLIMWIYRVEYIYYIELPIVKLRLTVNPS